MPVTRLRSPGEGDGIWGVRKGGKIGGKGEGVIIKSVQFGGGRTPSTRKRELENRMEGR